MRRRILILTVLTLLLVAAPASATTFVSAMGIDEQVDQERGISINVDGNNVSINGGQGLMLEVVSLTGRHVASFKIDSAAQRIELNLPKGCYILKIGKVVRKVTLR